MGLPDVFNYLSYIMWGLLIITSGNSYCTNIELFGRFFWICFMCSEPVTLIVSLMYSIYDAFSRWNIFCSYLLSAVICSKTYIYSWLFDYVQMED